MGRILHLDVLSILFGLGTWLCVNGLFVQLPLLVLALPEAWDLPSYLTVVIQIANFGPLAYTLLNSLFPRVVTEVRSIYCVMAIGLLATLLLANFWKETTVVGGRLHSTALFVLVFFLASVDCSSRVLYLPFMSKFREVYLMSYFIGEGLSGLVPSLVALIQGVGGNPECRNKTDGTPGTDAFTPPARFSVGVFFYFLFAMSVVSLTAFVLLNRKSIVQRGLLGGGTRTSSYVMDNGSKSSGENSQIYGTGDVSVFEPTPQALPTPKSENEDGSMPEFNESTTSTSTSSTTTTLSILGLSQGTFVYLLGLQVVTCFWANGVFPSIQSYASLPYGNVAYHLAVTLSNMTNPVICILAFVVPVPTTRSVSGVAAASLGVSGWILYLAVSSPEPPLMGRKAGEVIMVLSWIVLVALFTYVRISVATILREFLGKSGLFWCGAVSQVGSTLGALVSFFVVNYTEVFQPYYPCT